ncbi:MAG: biotin-dependent carboxyltransferase family protein [Luteimonas sp.]
MSVRVVTPGLLTTVQDLGRTGSRHMGVGCAGALDAYSHTIANLLVGNRPDSATLEITLAGPRLHFGQAARIAICGADIDAHVGKIAIPGWRPIPLPAGSVLALGACRRGARAYLAVAGGGFAVPEVLNSTSTDLRGGFGGFQGRALIAHDELDIGPSTDRVADVHITPWWVDPTPVLDFDAPTIIRVLPGSDATVPQDGLFAHQWRIANASDRQGLRLEGAALQLAETFERVSAPVVPGAIQLPADGLPIILMADAQTHGGYPVIGHVIRADWPRLAQLQPGDALHFQACTQLQARQARLDQAQQLARLALAIAVRHGT